MDVELLSTGVTLSCYLARGSSLGVGVEHATKIVRFCGRGVLLERLQAGVHTLRAVLPLERMVLFGSYMCKDKPRQNIRGHRQACCSLHHAHRGKSRATWTAKGAQQNSPCAA